MKKYCVIIGTDRLSNKQDVQELKQVGLLGDATSVLDLQINMGNKKGIEAEAANVAYKSQYQKLAISEWSKKGVNPSINSINVGKRITTDGALFIVATY